MKKHTKKQLRLMTDIETKKVHIVNFLQAVDKVDFSNRFCHSLLYFSHKGIKKEQI